MRRVALVGISMTRHIIPFLVPLLIPCPFYYRKEAMKGESSSPVYNISPSEKN
jgi:hypothetical protein